MASTSCRAALPGPNGYPADLTTLLPVLWPGYRATIRFRSASPDGSLLPGQLDLFTTCFLASQIYIPTHLMAGGAWPQPAFSDGLYLLTFCFLGWFNMPKTVFLVGYVYVQRIQSWALESRLLTPELAFWLSLSNSRTDLKIPDCALHALFRLVYFLMVASFQA